MKTATRSSTRKSTKKKSPSSADENLDVSQPCHVFLKELTEEELRQANVGENDENSGDRMKLRKRSSKPPGIVLRDNSSAPNKNDVLAPETSPENTVVVEEAKTKRITRKSHIPEPVAVDEPTVKRSRKSESNIKGVDHLIKMRESFDILSLPESLPSREEELGQITLFIESTLDAGVSDRMDISGMPGTGKTACVKRAVQNLHPGNRRRKHNFIFVELNGMLIPDPKELFVRLYKELKRQGIMAPAKKGQSTSRAKVSTATAMKTLDTIFNLTDDDRPAIVLLVDELDLLVTKRQQTLYNLFEWTTRPQAKLILITIANTLDLLERQLTRRINSRAGMKRLLFQPYTHEQIGKILRQKLDAFPAAVDATAVQLIARKVASVSGDLRRAFKACRSAIDKAISANSPTLQLSHAHLALQQAATNPKVQALRYASKHEILFLKAALAEYNRTGREQQFTRIYKHYYDYCSADNVEPMLIGPLTELATRLTACSLLHKSSNKGFDAYNANYHVNITEDDLELAKQPV